MRNNLAYDISLYTEKAKPEKKPDFDKITQSKKAVEMKKLRNYLAALAISLILSAGMIYNNVMINELNKRIMKQKKENEIVNSQTISLNMEIGTNTSKSKAEEYAVNVLGMVKLSDSQIIHISITSGNKIEIVKEQEVSVLNKIQKFFTEFVENIIA